MIGSSGPYNKKKKVQYKKPSVPYVELNVSTWAKDSHALYDYQAAQKNYQTQSYLIKKSSKIYRHVTSMKTVIQECDQKRELAMQNIYVSSIVTKQNQKSYYLQSADASKVQPHPILKNQHPDLFKNSYLVLKDFNYKQGVSGYPLRVGSILRLGRLQYLVIETKTQKGIETLKETSHLQLNRQIFSVTQEITGSCKVCLCQEFTQDDPLINPCKCKGSCQLIHVGCLKSWINVKIKKEIVGLAITYNFAKIQCQICKELLPKDIKLKNSRIVQMVTFDKPQKPYIIFQSYSSIQPKDEKKQRNLHLICPDQKSPVKIGRGHQCQIRLTDISVSRVHAQIRSQNDQFYVRDVNSKFGTLIKFRQEFELKDQLKLQYGRTCLHFKLINEAEKVQDQQDDQDEIPVFYTRAQLREMGQLSDNDDQDY